MRKLYVILVTALLLGCGGGGGGGGNSGAVPVATLSGPTEITTNSASFNGNVIPNGLSTECWFEYGVDPALSNHTDTSHRAVGSGITSQGISEAINGLTTGTTYYYRICASNSLGTAASSIGSFTTSSPGSPPVASTLPATSVSATGGTLNANVTANGLPTNAWFEWGTDPTLSTYSSTSAQSIGSGTTSLAVSESLAGLSSGTIYYFRAAAINSAGIDRGSIGSFTPGGAPSVMTLSATSVTSTGATLNGNVWTFGLPTNAWFEWGTDPALATYSTTTVHSLGWGTSVQTLSESLSGLNSGTTYYFRAAAINSTGVTRGTIVEFTPNAAPLVRTFAVTSMTATEATITGNVNPNGSATNAWFEWSFSYNFSSINTTSVQAVGSGSGGHLVSANLTALAPGYYYYYRIVAKNDPGYSTGDGYCFVAPNPGGIPTINSASVDNITSTTATVSFYVNPNGLGTEAWVECTYWPAGAPLPNIIRSPHQAVGGDSGNHLVTVQLTGLPPGMFIQPYIQASNSSGTNGCDHGPRVTWPHGYFESLDFSTSSIPTVTTLPATQVGFDTAVLNSSVNANGKATTAWFEWGQDPSLATYASTAAQSAGSGSSVQAISATMTGLSSGTVYYFRAVANNADGTTRGEIRSFTSSELTIEGAVGASATLHVFRNNKEIASFVGGASPTGFTCTDVRGAYKFVYSLNGRHYSVFDGSGANVFQLSAGGDIRLGDPPVSVDDATAKMVLNISGSGFSSSYQAAVNFGGDRSGTLIVTADNNTVPWQPNGISYDNTTYFQNQFAVSKVDSVHGTFYGTVNGDLIYIFKSGNYIGWDYTFMYALVADSTGDHAAGDSRVTWASPPYSLYYWAQGPYSSDRASAFSLAPARALSRTGTTGGRAWALPRR